MRKLASINDSIACFEFYVIATRSLMILANSEQPTIRAVIANKRFGAQTKPIFQIKTIIRFIMYCSHDTVLLLLFFSDLFLRKKKVKQSRNEFVCSEAFYFRSFSFLFFLKNEFSFQLICIIISLRTKTLHTRRENSCELVVM